MNGSKTVYCACSNRDCMYVFYVVPNSRKNFDECPRCKSVCYVHWHPNYASCPQHDGDLDFEPGDGSRWEEIE